MDLQSIAILTSMLDAALAVTQRQQGVLVYPSPTQDAESAAGREVSQLGTQITRKNLNVQPTIKIPPGYKFNVRAQSGHSLRRTLHASAAAAKRWPDPKIQQVSPSLPGRSAASHRARREEMDEVRRKEFGSHASSSKEHRR
jgi:hypothetical protein